jgi:hypothetical protein
LLEQLDPGDSRLDEATRAERRAERTRCAEGAAAFEFVTGQRKPRRVGRAFCTARATVASATTTASSACSARRSRPRRRCLRARTRFGSSSSTTVAVPARAVTSRCTSTVSRSATVASNARTRTTTTSPRPPVSAATRARRSATTTRSVTTPFSGTIDWVRIDVGEDSHDHLVDPEHLLNLAMNRQ